MTQEQILEGDILIAKLNGWKEPTEEWLDGYFGTARRPSDKELWPILRNDGYSIYSDTDMYYKSWKWLMEAVENVRHMVFAIEIIFCLGTIVKIRYNEQWHTYESNNSKEAIWYALVDFAKWYNQQSIS